MGFHKRILNEEVIRKTFKNEGLKGLLSLFNADVIIAEDKTSDDITNLVMEHYNLKDDQLLESKILEKLCL